MISANARAGFDNVLKDAACNAMVNDPSQICELETIETVTATSDKKLIVLTISGYLFRLMVFIHFADTFVLRQHMARRSRENGNALSDQEFTDVLQERANMCCGAMSRNLTQVFPHLGMSTPNMLSSHCIRYLPKLQGGHVQHFRVHVDNAALVEMSLCVSEYADLDFTLEIAAADANTGELEMF